MSFADTQGVEPPQYSGFFFEGVPPDWIETTLPNR